MRKIHILRADQDTEYWRLDRDLTIIRKLVCQKKNI